MKNKSLYLQIMAVFAGISLIMVFGIGLLAFFESQKLLEKQFQDDLKEKSQIIYSSIDEQIKISTSTIQALANGLKKFKEKDFPSQGMLDFAVKTSPVFQNIYLFDQAGKALAVSYKDGRDVSEYLEENFNNFASDPNLKSIFDDINRVRYSGKMAFSKVFVTQNGSVMFSIIAPVKFGEEILGIISCGVNLNNEESGLQKLLSSLGTSKKGFSAIIGEDMDILLGVGNVPAKKEISLPNITPSEKSFIHGNHMLVYRKMENCGLAIFTGISLDEINEQLNRLGAQIFFYALFIVILALIVGSIASRKIIVPITELVKGLNCVKNGDLSYKVSISGSGEVKEAVVAYNELVQRIEKDLLVDKMWTELWNG